MSNVTIDDDGKRDHNQKGYDLGESQLRKAFNLNDDDKTLVIEDAASDNKTAMVKISVKNKAEGDALVARLQKVDGFGSAYYDDKDNKVKFSADPVMDGGWGYIDGLNNSKNIELTNGLAGFTFQSETDRKKLSSSIVDLEDVSIEFAQPDYKLTPEDQAKALGATNVIAEQLQEKLAAAKPGSKEFWELKKQDQHNTELHLALDAAKPGASGEALSDLKTKIDAVNNEIAVNNDFTTPQKGDAKAPGDKAAPPAGTSAAVTDEQYNAAKKEINDLIEKNKTGELTPEERETVMGDTRLVNRYLNVKIADAVTKADGKAYKELKDEQDHNAAVRKAFEQDEIEHKGKNTPQNTIVALIATLLGIDAEKLGQIFNIGQGSSGSKSAPGTVPDDLKGLSPDEQKLVMDARAQKAGQTGDDKKDPATKDADGKTEDGKKPVSLTMPNGADVPVGPVAPGTIDSLKKKLTAFNDAAIKSGSKNVLTGAQIDEIAGRIAQQGLGDPKIVQDELKTLDRLTNEANNVANLRTKDKQGHLVKDDGLKESTIGAMDNYIKHLQNVGVADHYKNVKTGADVDYAAQANDQFDKHVQATIVALHKGGKLFTAEGKNVDEKLYAALVPNSTPGKGGAINKQNTPKDI